MSGQLLPGKRTVAWGIVWTSAFAIAGCGPSMAGRHTPAVHGNPAAYSALTQARAQARLRARAEITGCVNKTIPTGLPSASGRTATVNCITSLVPRGRRTPLGTCLRHAAARDNVWTARGRQTFEAADGPDCVTAASR